MGMLVPFTGICEVSADDDRLVTRFHRLWMTQAFTALALVLGLFPVAFGVWAALTGQGLLPLITMLCSGGLVAAAGFIGLRWSLREWGEVTVDETGVRWTRGDEEVGFWPRAEITSVARRWATFYGSGRIQYGWEYVLEAHTTSGQRVRLVHGYPDEVEKVDAWVRRCWDA